MDGAVAFDGDDAILAEDLPLNGEGATVGTWVNYTDFDEWARVFHFGEGSTGPSGDGRPDNGFVLQFDGTSDGFEVMVRAGGGTNELGVIDVSPETWLFAVAVLDGTDVRFHVFDTDGELDASPFETDGPDRSQSDSAGIVLGAGDGRYVTGRMDEVRAYSRALLPTEVEQLYRMSE